MNSSGVMVVVSILVFISPLCHGVCARIIENGFDDGRMNQLGART